MKQAGRAHGPVYRAVQALRPAQRHHKQTVRYLSPPSCRSLYTEQQIISYLLSDVVLPAFSAVLCALYLCYYDPNPVETLQPPLEKYDSLFYVVNLNSCHHREANNAGVWQIG